MKISVSKLFTVVLFLAIVALNSFLLFDQVPSLDDRNYAYTWSQGFRGGIWPESAYSFAGEVFSSFSYKWFFLLVNTFSLLKIARKKGVAWETKNLFFVILLTSPFTVFGFGNTYLSFTAALLYIAFWTPKTVFKPVLISTFFHTGAVFLAVLHSYSYKFLGAIVLIGLVSAAMYVGSSGALQYLDSFDVSFFEITSLVIFILIPPILAGVLAWNSRLIWLSVVCLVLVGACWFIIPKLANRVTFFLAVPVLYVSAISFETCAYKLKRQLLVSLCVVFNAVGFIASGAGDLF